MTISGAFKQLASVLLTASIGAVSKQRTAVLLYVHSNGTAPLSVNVGEFLAATVPSSGLFWSTVHNAMMGQMPELEQNVAAGLDARAASVFDWTLSQGQRLASYLAQS